MSFPLASFWASVISVCLVSVIDCLNSQSSSPTWCHYDQTHMGIFFLHVCREDNMSTYACFIQTVHLFSVVWFMLFIRIMHNQCMSFFEPCKRYIFINLGKKPIVLTASLKSVLTYILNVSFIFVSQQCSKQHI